MSPLSRSGLQVSQAAIRVRTFHLSAPVLSAGHGEYHHLPFQFPGHRKFSFGLKLATFLSFGFSIPFLASYHQIQKSKGGAD